MAAENIGAIYNTKIPSLADPADIQEAIKLYHYGSLAYNTANTDPTLLPNPSMARYLNDIQEQITELEELGFGSSYEPNEPTTPQNGYIWVDSDAAIDSQILLPSVAYQNDAPTNNLVDGLLWVDKNSSPLLMYVYDSVLGWRQIGA